jgi:hypothetical protein
MSESELVLSRLVSLEARLPFRRACCRENAVGLVLGDLWDPAGGELGPPELGRLGIARGGS